MPSERRAWYSYRMMAVVRVSDFIVRGGHSEEVTVKDLTDGILVAFGHEGTPSLLS